MVAPSVTLRVRRARLRSHAKSPTTRISSHTVRADGRQRGRQQVVRRIGGVVDEKSRGAGYRAHGGLRKESDEENSGQRQRHSGDAEIIDFGGFGHFVRAGRAEEHRAVELGEGQNHNSADQRQCSQSGRRSEHVAARSDAVEHAEVDQQFRDEPVERRQGADGRRAGQKQQARDGHVPAQPSQRIERGGVRLGEYVAGSEEEQRFEQRVVECVEQCARKSADRRELVARTLAQRRDAQSDQDDADVFDRRVGQQPLHVVLRRGEDHAPESRDDACDEQDQACGTERRAGRRSAP